MTAREHLEQLAAAADRAIDQWVDAKAYETGDDYAMAVVAHCVAYYQAPRAPKGARLWYAVWAKHAATSLGLEITLEGDA